MQKLEKTMNKLNAFPKRNFEPCSFYTFDRNEDPGESIERVKL